MVSTAHFRYAETESGAVSFQVKRALCKQNFHSSEISGSTMLIFFGHIVTCNVTGWQEGKDAKEWKKGSRSFLAPEYHVFLLNICRQTHCLSQSEEGSKRGKPQCQNTQRLVRWTAALPLIYTCRYGSTGGLSKTMLCSPITFKRPEI